MLLIEKKKSSQKELDVLKKKFESTFFDETDTKAVKFTEQSLKKGRDNLNDVMTEYQISAYFYIVRVSLT